MLLLNSYYVLHDEYCNYLTKYYSTYAQFDLDIVNQNITWLRDLSILVFLIV